MPRRDGTGPIGQGAMTGRGLGACCSANKAYGSSSAGLGLGRGYNCCRNINTQAVLDKRSILKEQKATLEARLEEVNKQLKQ